MVQITTNDRYVYLIQSAKGALSGRNTNRNCNINVQIHSAFLKNKKLLHKYKLHFTKQVQTYQSLKQSQSQMYKNTRISISCLKFGASILQ